MPLPLIALILAAVAGIVAISLTILYWDEILDWFRQRQSIKASDTSNICLTLKQKLKSGEYKVVQGIFNTESNELLDGRVVEAKELDKQISAQHKNNDLVIYN